MIQRIQEIPRAQAKDETFLVMAGMLSLLGTCDRKKVGAIITRQGRCVSWGFNGAPPGMPHCSENAHGWATPIRHPNDELIVQSFQAEWDMMLQEHGCRNATHAEANALSFAARSGISTEGGTCYVTVSPCDVCARLLLAAGIEEVIYAEEYRDRRGIEILIIGGVACRNGTRDGGVAGTTG